MKHQNVVIREFENEFEAEIAKGQLADAGIAAMIVKDDGGGMIPSLQNAEGVQLIVQSEWAEEAKVILDGGIDSEE